MTDANSVEKSVFVENSVKNLNDENSVEIVCVRRHTRPSHKKARRNDSHQYFYVFSVKHFLLCFLLSDKDLESLIDPGSTMCGNDNSMMGLSALQHSVAMKEEVVLAESRNVHEAQKLFKQMQDLEPFIEKAQVSGM